MNDDPLVNYIMSQTLNYGPSLKTGGYIRKIEESTAADIASYIRKYAPQYKFGKCNGIAVITAGMAGESRFDPLATCPNNQVAKPNETEHERLLHTDCGLAQFDYATLVNEFANDAAFLKAVYDPNWATSRMCEFVQSLFVDVNNRVAAELSILNGVPGHDIRVLTFQAYNAGAHGACSMARDPNSVWTYGMAWLHRYIEVCAHLGVHT